MQKKQPSALKSISKVSSNSKYQYILVTVNKKVSSAFDHKVRQTTKVRHAVGAGRGRGLLKVHHGPAVIRIEPS